MYNLIKTYRGKSHVVMTDSLSLVNRRMRALRESQRGKCVEYSVEKTEETIKFKEKPHGREW